MGMEGMGRRINQTQLGGIYGNDDNELKGEYMAMFILYHALFLYSECLDRST